MATIINLGNRFENSKKIKIDSEISCLYSILTSDMFAIISLIESKW